MSDISTDVLKKEINAVLKTADLYVITARKVREEVEKKLQLSLASRKKEVDNIVMELIKLKQEEAASDGSDASSAGADPEDNDSEQSEDDNDSSSDDDDDDNLKGSAKKRRQSTQRKSVPKQKKKRKSINAQDTATESDAASDSDYEMPKRQKESKKAGTESAGSGGRKSTGFTRAYNLSPELSALMGADALPRHEVVKKVWAIIKERDLYDPKNRQFAICDAELLKIMKVKRFRTFGMLKHLKPHFLN